MDNPPQNDKHKGLGLVSASGLDERQIAPEDIAALNALFRCVDISLKLPCNVCALNLATVQPRLSSGLFVAGLSIPEPRPLRIRIEPLPKKIKARRMQLKPGRIRIKANLPASLAQPIRRRKLRLSMLTEQQQEKMSRELFKKYGDSAQGMYLVAAFANIPAESAKSIRVDGQLRYATFVPSRPGRNKGGYYLLILERKGGQTEKVLVRL